MHLYLPSVVCFRITLVFYHARLGVTHFPSYWASQSYLVFVLLPGKRSVTESKLPTLESQSQSRVTLTVWLCKFKRMDMKKLHTNALYDDSKVFNTTRLSKKRVVPSLKEINSSCLSAFTSRTALLLLGGSQVNIGHKMFVKHERESSFRLFWPEIFPGKIHEST